MEAASISRTSFPPVDRAQWMMSAGAGNEARQPRPGPMSRDGLLYERMRGIVTADDAPLSAAGRQWALVQRVDDVDAKRANAQAQEDLAAGATGLAIVFAGAPNAFGFGLPPRPEALAAALHGIQFHKLSLRIDVHPASRASVDWIVEIMRRKRTDPSRLNLSFGIDPAAILAGLGRLRMSIEALRASMPQSLAHFFAMGLPAVLLEADARVLHNAGASEAQELGVMLASAVSHLRLFEDARQPLVYAVPHIGFALSTDQDQMLSAAKILALRKLWRKAQETCSLPPSVPRVHAETSFRMQTAGDPQTNIVRNAIAAFAAASAGADTISVLPHTMANGLPDARARAVARETQLILAEESHAGLLGNPASDSHDLDLLTATLCEAAWEEFRQIEAEGGLLESLSQGRIQSRVHEARGERLRRIAERRGATSVSRVPGRSRQGSEGILPAARLPLPEDGVHTCDPLPMRRLEELMAPDQ